MCGEITDTYRGISIHALLAESDLRPSTFRTVRVNFNPRSPCGERQRSYRARAQQARISIHALLAESDHGRPDSRHVCQISIHALLAESDRCAGKSLTHTVAFQSTLSLRRATQEAWAHISKALRFQSTLSLRRATCRCRNPRPTGGHFNPRSPCGERQAEIHAATLPDDISIHALLAESDLISDASGGVYHDFNPRSPCGERLWVAVIVATVIVFQSTLSLRRATWDQSSSGRVAAYFNPRSPCGERRSCINCM